MWARAMAMAFALPAPTIRISPTCTAPSASNVSAKTGDKRPISRSSGAPLNDRRAVVGSSGKPLPGMILESGAKQVGQILGKYTTHGEGMRTSGDGHFNVSDIQDKSIGAPPDGS